MKILILLVAAAAVGSCRTPSRFDAKGRDELAAEIVSVWSPFSRLTAERVIERYGLPDAVSQDALGWGPRDGWKRIVVWNAGPEYISREGTSDDLEETVSYLVPESRRRDIEAIGRGVRVSSDGRELSARSSDEERNFLALNLADEVARGRREPADARKLYDRTVELAVSGKTQPYMKSLRFTPNP